MTLLNGETLRFSAFNTRTVYFDTNEEINDKYIKGDVRIVTEQARYPLNTIVSIVESDDYQLNPEFQRRHRWDKAKQSRLIESFIMNVPIPPIFLYEVSFSKYEVMDGLQRLTAIYEFYKDKLVLQDLIEWPELNGRVYSTLPTQIKNGVNRRYLSSIILLQETAKNENEAARLKQLVFERINSGGVQLEPQEARNAIYNGPLNQLCIKLARDPYLCKMWDIPEPTKEEIDFDTISEELLSNETYRKMADVELVLRFYALRQRAANPQGALRVYLDSFVKFGNEWPEPILAAMAILFKKTAKLVYDTLGERAFRLWRPRKNQPWDWYDRAALTAYDPIMYVFAQHLDEAEKILNASIRIRECLPEFYEANYDSFGGRSTTNISSIVDRNNLFDQFLTSIIGSKDEI